MILLLNIETCFILISQQSEMNVIFESRYMYVFVFYQQYERMQHKNVCEHQYPNVCCFFFYLNTIILVTSQL